MQALSRLFKEAFPYGLMTHIRLLFTGGFLYTICKDQKMVCQKGKVKHE